MSQEIHSKGTKNKSLQVCVAEGVPVAGPSAHLRRDPTSRESRLNIYACARAVHAHERSRPVNTSVQNRNLGRGPFERVLSVRGPLAQLEEVPLGSRKRHHRQRPP